MRAVLLALAALLALTFGTEVRLGAQAFDLQAEIDACPSFGRATWR